MAKKTAGDWTDEQSGTSPETKGKTASRPGGATPRKGSRLKMVRRLIAKWAADLEEHPGKAGVTELVRLLSLEKELSETREDIKEIKVSWVDPKSAEPSGSE